jgi:hypothetical protein
MRIKTKPDGWDILIIIGMIFIIISIPLIFHVASDRHKDRCQAFCHCQEVGDCNFTFDYDDVKDCDCK